jgi:hypothetical protein
MHQSLLIARAKILKSRALRQAKMVELTNSLEVTENFKSEESADIVLKEH